MIRFYSMDYNRSCKWPSFKHNSLNDQVTEKTLSLQNRFNKDLWLTSFISKPKVLGLMEKWLVWMVKRSSVLMVGLVWVLKASISKLCIWKTKGRNVIPCCDTQHGTVWLSGFLSKERSHKPAHGLICSLTTGLNWLEKAASKALPLNWLHFSSMLKLVNCTEY